MKLSPATFASERGVRNLASWQEMDNDLAEHLRGLPRPRVLYTDLDGTLLGPRGSVLTGPDGRPSARAAHALTRAAEAGLTVIPVSGRRRVQLHNDARLLGLSDCIAEAGAVIVRGDDVMYEWGACPRDLADTPHDALTASGAVDTLLTRFAGHLRHYEPWHTGREGSHLFHGQVDVEEANALLDSHGCGWAYLVDNGLTAGWPGREVRAYHLLPRGIGKATAVADDLAARGLQAEQAMGCGDSLEDLTIAAVVGTYCIVANGHGEPSANVFRLSEPMGHGFAEAVDAALDADLNAKD